MGSPHYFPIYLFLILLENVWLIIGKLTYFTNILNVDELCKCVGLFGRIIQNPLEYFLHHFNNSKDNCSSLFQGEDHGDFKEKIMDIWITYLIQDLWEMSEDLKGSYIVIIGIFVERKVDM